MGGRARVAVLAGCADDQVHVEASRGSGRHQAAGAQGLVVGVRGHDHDAIEAVELEPGGRAPTPVAPPTRLGRGSRSVVGERPHHGWLPQGGDRRPAQRGGVTFRVVLAHVDAQVGDPGGVLGLDGQWPGSEGVVGDADGRLDRVGHDLTDPQRKERAPLVRWHGPGRSRRRTPAARTGHRGASRRPCRGVPSRSGPALARLACRRSRRAMPTAPPYQIAATPMPPQAKPSRSQVPARSADGGWRRPTGTTSGVLRTPRSPWETQARGWTVTAGLTKRDGEQAALVLVDPGRDQGMVDDLGERAPGLGAVQLPGVRRTGRRDRGSRCAHSRAPAPSAAYTPHVEPARAAIGEVGVAGLGQDRERVEVRLRDTSHGQVDRSEGGQSRPAFAGPTDTRDRDHGPEVARQGQCLVEVARGCSSPRCEVGERVATPRSRLGC